MMSRRTTLPKRQVTYRRHWWLGILCVFLLVSSKPAQAQDGWYIFPSASVAEYYDDNVFRTTSGKTKDFVSRFAGGLQTGYESTPFTLLGQYNFAAEVFSQHPKLSKAPTLQAFDFTVRRRPNRYWTLGFTAAYLETERPEQLNVATGILGELRRSRSTRLLPSIEYAADAFTTITAGYIYDRNQQDQGARNESHEARLRVNRRITNRDSVGINYEVRQFNIANNQRSGVTAAQGKEGIYHVTTLNWDRQLSPLTKLSLEAGPRFSHGSLDPEVEASLARLLPRGAATLTYARTQNTVVGSGGPVNTESIRLSIEQRLAQNLLLNIDPGYYRNTGSNFTTNVYLVEVGLRYQLNRWLSLRSAYHFNFEDGDIVGTGTTVRGERRRNVLLLELTTTYPYRIY